MRMSKRLIQVIFGLAALVLLGMLAILIWARTAPRPDDLGITDGVLAPCPNTPNCVTTQQGNSMQVMEPIPYTTTQPEAQERLLQQVQAMDRATVLANRPGYIAVVFRSPTFGFPDDTEFLFDDAAKVIHFRSAARLGQSDLGVNRARMEAIRAAFEQGYEK